MGLKEERDGGWGKPLKIIVVILAVLLIYRFGSWIIYGIQTAGSKKDIVIVLEDDDVDRFQTKQTKLSYFVDLDKKKIYFESTKYSLPGNKYEVLSILNSSKRRVLDKADLNNDDIELLLSMVKTDYVPKSKRDKIRGDYLENNQKYTIEFSTDRIDNYYATVEAYRYDIETILDNFDTEKQTEPEQ